MWSNWATFRKHQGFRLREFFCLVFECCKVWLEGMFFWWQQTHMLYAIWYMFFFFSTFFFLGRVVFWTWRVLLWMALVGYSVFFAVGSILNAYQRSDTYERQNPSKSSASSLAQLFHQESQCFVVRPIFPRWLATMNHILRYIYIYTVYLSGHFFYSISIWANYSDLNPKWWLVRESDPKIPLIQV